MLKTIQEVFSENLRRYRGARTQAAMAEKADMPFVSYQRAENGDIPQRVNLEKLARAFGVTETALFRDPDLDSRPTPLEALEVIREALEKPASINPVVSKIAEVLPALQENELRLILNDIRGIRPDLFETAAPSKRKDKQG